MHNGTWPKTYRNSHEINVKLEAKTKAFLNDGMMKTANLVTHTHIHKTDMYIYL
jgi:hypothetical protein